MENKNIAQTISKFLLILHEFYRMVVSKISGKRYETLAVIKLKSVWINIYKEWFDVNVDFSNLFIPNFYDPTKHFAVIVAKGLTLNQIIAGMRKEVNVDFYAGFYGPIDPNLHVINHDYVVPINSNSRVADCNYVAVFYKNIAADENLENTSADRLADMNISGITLLERLLLEILCIEQVEKNLDNNGTWTLCSGSRDSDGDVPCVTWRRNCLYIDCEAPTSHGCNLRSRAVVSR